MQRFYEASTLYPVLCCYDSWVCKDFFCVSIKDLNWIELYSKDGNVFVCADIYDQKYRHNEPWKLRTAAMLCYIVSLLSLLATFVIYTRYPTLRTKQGLMLLHLVVALFFAQILYVLNSFGLYENSLTLCQIMATIQHYFWLVSFAWMLCIS